MKTLSASNFYIIFHFGLVSISDIKYDFPELLEAKSPRRKLCSGSPKMSPIEGVYIDLLAYIFIYRKKILTNSTLS